MTVESPPPAATPPLPDLPELPPLIRQILETEPSTEALVHGTPRGRRRIGMVLKRTYRVRLDGVCELAPDDEQDVVTDGAYTYGSVDPPQVAPVAFDDDTMAFRDLTDVVVQGSAYAGDAPRTKLTVSLRIGDFLREITVYGDRQAEWRGDGRVRFTDPEPFEEMSLRYDKAYGGFDPVAMERFTLPAFEELKAARPEWQLDAHTPFHYRRNPAGVGFLINLDEASVARVTVPNLEFPFDPVTPERLAVGSAENWLRAPLPAGMDWTAPEWFPRVGYLGGARRAPGCRVVPKEVELGWAPPDIFEIPSILQTQEMRPEFTQAASPGMSFPGLPRGAVFEIRHMHPARPVWRLQLPAEVPQVKLGLEAPALTDLEPHLNAVVVRPDADEVVMIWCAHVACERKYTPQQALDMRREIAWRTIEE